MLHAECLSAMRSKRHRIAILAGLVALFWFLVRVVPKPSRASHPCQRAAATLATGFVIWLASTLGSASLFRRGKRLWRTALGRYDYRSRSPALRNR